MKSLRTICLLLALLLAGLLPCACNPENVTETEVRVFVGPSGGTVLGPRGSRLLVPYGVLEQVTEFSLIQMPTEEIPDNPPFERRSIALKVEPSDVTFSQPLTVQLSYNPSGLSVTQQRSRLAVFRLASEAEAWEALDSAVILETNEIRATTPLLGTFAVFFDPEEPETDGDEPDKDPGDCSCGDWLGLFCRAPEDGCSDLAALRFESLSTATCQTRLVAYDTQGDMLFIAEVSDCGPDRQPVFSRPDVGDCVLSFDPEQPTLSLTCGLCADSFGLDQACPVAE